MSGIDPYASAASDVYQDLFGEGSYTGKGIYDVDAFEAALAGRVPESTLLSHDLFEGTFARAGLASDIEVVEEFPSRYDVAAARQHRWARGDWQLLPWIFGRGDASVANRGRRASADRPLEDARQSAADAVCAGKRHGLAGGMDPALQPAAVWTCFILSTIAVPTLLPVLAAIVPRRAGSWLGATCAPSARIFGCVVPDRIGGDVPGTSSMVDDRCDRQDVVSSVREPAAFARMGHGSSREVQPELGLLGSYRLMAGGVVIGIVAAIVVWCAGGAAWPVAAPFVVLWIASPAVADGQAYRRSWRGVYRSRKPTRAP